MNTLVLFPSFARKLAGRKSEAFSGLRQELKHNVDRMMEGFGGAKADLDTLSEEQPAPRGLDIRETAAGMEIECEFAGFDERDIKITLSGNVLTIRAEKKVVEEKNARNGTGRVTERCFSALSQRVTLPFQPNANKLASSFAHGILHVSIRKAPVRS